MGPTSMLLMDAIQKLTLNSVMGVDNTDWSWYYRLGVDTATGQITVLDQDNNIAEFDYYEMTTPMWVITDKSIIESEEK